MRFPCPKARSPTASPPPACWASLWSRYSRPWLPRAPRGNTSCMSSPGGRDPGFEKGRPGRRGKIGLHAPPKAVAPPHRLCPRRGLLSGGDVPKSPFPPTFAEEVILVDTMICSAGKVGYQVEVDPRRSDHPGGRAGGGPHPAITQKEEDTPRENAISHSRQRRPRQQLKKY